MEETPKIPLVFYRTASGREPVREWLKGLDRDDRLAAGGDLLACKRMKEVRNG